MRSILFLLAVAIGVHSLGPGAAFGQVAYDNRGGVLYLALAPEIKYDPLGSYCGLSGTPLPSQAITQGEVNQDPQIAFVIASWPDSARPEIGAVAFGVRFPRGIEILRWGACQRTMNVPTNAFPLSGEGVAIALAGGTRDTSRTIEIAWMVIVARTPGKLELVPHPNPLFGSHFATGSNPVEAPIAGLGYLGFGESGSAPTPEWPGPTLGAACVMDSICCRITQKEAEYYGPRTLWFGEGVFCTSNLCRRDAPTGACCLPDGTCTIMTRKSCVPQNGKYQGDASVCAPDPCAPAGGGDAPPGSKEKE